MPNVKISELVDALDGAALDGVADELPAVDADAGGGPETKRTNPVAIAQAGLRDGALIDDLDVGGHAITNVGDVDGRDVSVDGAKLDTIEDNADVTDTANVDAAGAVMDDDAPLTTQPAAPPGSTAAINQNAVQGESVLWNVSAPAGEPATADAPYYLEITDGVNTETVVVVEIDGATRYLAAPLEHGYSAGSGTVAYAGIATTPTEQGLMSAAAHHKLEAIERGANVTADHLEDDLEAALQTAVAGRLMRTGPSQFSSLQDNLAAGAAPTVNDDSSAGYAPGSLWVWGGGGIWICGDASVGAAFWIPVPIGNNADGSIQPVGDTADAGTADDYARADHVHARAAPRAVRTESGTSFTVDGDDHDRPIQVTNTGEVGATFDSATEGTYGTIILTGSGGTVTLNSGTATVQVEEGFTTTTLAPGASTGVTLSYVYLTATLVHVVGGLAAA